MWLRTEVQFPVSYTIRAPGHFLNAGWPVDSCDQMHDDTKIAAKFRDIVFVENSWLKCSKLKYKT